MQLLITSTDYKDQHNICLDKRKDAKSLKSCCSRSLLAYTRTNTYLFVICLVILADPSCSTLHSWLWTYLLETNVETQDCLRVCSDKIGCLWPLFVSELSIRLIVSCCSRSSLMLQNVLMLTKKILLVQVLYVQNKLYYGLYCCGI